MCHSPASAKPFKSDHPWSTNEACNTCHQSAPKLKTLPAAKLPDAKPIPHTTNKLEECLVCHSPSSANPISKEHPWSTNDTCTTCHLMAPELKTLPVAVPPIAKEITHSTTKLEDCLSCHSPSSVRPFSQDHPWSTNELCATCHKQSPVLASIQPSTIKLASEINHPTSGYGNCSQCHNTAGPGPFPSDHVGRPESFCPICHKPGAVVSLPVPVVTTPVIPTIPHETGSSRQDCLLCHSQSGGIKPVSFTHTGRTNETCLLCHKAAAPAQAVPSAPTALSATVVNAGQVNLSWTDNASNETGFRLERATNSTFTANLLPAVLSAGATSYNDTSVAGSTTYYYRLFAFNYSGDSAASNIASVTTPAPTVTAPSAPTSLTASAVSATQVNLSWTDNASNETGSRLERATNNTFTANLTPVQLSAGTTTYNDTGVAGSTTYYYRVFAFNSGGDSTASNTASVTTPAAPPPAPLAPLIAHTTWDTPIALPAIQYREYDLTPQTTQGEQIARVLRATRHRGTQLRQHYR